MHELELDDATAVEGLIELCTNKIEDRETRLKTIDLITRAKETQKMVVSLGSLDLGVNHETIPLPELPKLLAKLLIGNGGASQIGERIETSSRCVSRVRAETGDTCPVGQALPRSIVSAVVAIKKHTKTDLRRNFHTRGTLRMKSSAIL